MLPAIAQLLNSPDFETIVPKLASTLAEQPPWRGAFFEAAAGLPRDYARGFARLVTALSMSKAPVTPGELSPLLSRLRAEGDFEQARLLWVAARTRGLVSNGGFERTTQRLNVSVPAEWDIPSESRTGIEVLATPEGRVFRITRPKGSGWVLSQDLMLKTGSYILSYLARASGGQPVQVKWELQCTNSALRQSAIANIPGDGKWRPEQAPFDVPEQDCPIQKLVLRTPTATPTAEILIDNVGIESITR